MPWEPQAVDGWSCIHRAGGLRRARVVFAWQMVTRGPLVSIFFSLASDSKNDLPHGRDHDVQLSWVCQEYSGQKSFFLQLVIRRSRCVCSLSESALAREQSFPDVLIIALFTDYRGSRLIKLIASRYPLSALLKNFSEQFLHTGIRPGVGWSPRETNAAKDRLANDDSTCFSPSLRVRVFLLRPPW